MTDKRALVHEQLTHVFRTVFEDDDIVLTDETTAQDIDDWDSVMHITLVVAVEKAFNVRLNAAEVGNLANVGRMIDLLVERS